MSEDQTQFLTEKEAETITNKCSGCGATMDYDIESGNLKCGHCGNIKNIENDDKVERRQMCDALTKERAEWNESAVFRCDGCGAKQSLDKKDISRNCPFCGNPNVVAIEELAGIKPDSVIPFQITKESAVDRFRKWIKTRWLAPRMFKTADIRERINGLYSSSWSFSAQTDNNYSGTLGRRVQTYHRVRNSSGQYVTQTRTEIKYFRVNGQLSKSYLDFFVQSGDKISPAMFNKLKPFDMKLLKVYRQEYLSGIVAEHYTRNLDLCFTEFANFIRSDLRRDIMRRHNADVVQSLDIRTNYRDRKFNYVLLPVYIANYMYNKKNFNFYINGASGQIVGKYPKSKIKVALIVLGVVAVAAAVGVGLFLGGFFS